MSRPPRRVLYADDVKPLRELLQIVLSKEGYGVDTVANGALALQLITLNPSAYDLLITDHHMPDLNGLELVTAVRKLPFPGKIIIFSSELGQDVTNSYQRLGVDRLLHKPVFPAALRKLIAELFAAG